MTSEFTFQPAEKVKRKARVAIIAPAGGGKTYSALLMARGLVGESGRIAVLDTEHASASLYARVTKFDTLSLTAPFTPARYAGAARAAAEAGYDVLVVDSMSQEWNGEGGVLQMVEAKKTQVRNDFAAWNGPSQEHERMLETLVALPIHIISTFQSKTEYSLTSDGGRTRVEKLGMGAITRDGVEYRYDLVLEMTLDHKAVVTKSRIPEFADQVITKPGIEHGAALRKWLDDGVTAAPAPTAMTPDTRLTVEATLITAKVRSDERYNAAALRLRDAGYRNLSDFYARGTEAEAQDVLMRLAEPSSPPPPDAPKAEQQVPA